MLELTREDFYRCWILVNSAIREMSESPSYSQQTQQEDFHLQEKLEILWKMKQRAIFEMKQRPSQEAS